jgi:hypothetical protein
MVIFNQNKLNEDAITNYMNNAHTRLEFKLTMEENNNTSSLDLLMHRGNHNLQMEIYGKSTQTDTTIHYTSNYPLEHKLAAYRFYISRMLFTPITDQARQQEWNIIRIIAKNYGVPLRFIHNLKNKIIKTQNIDNTLTNTQRKTWVTFTCRSPLIHKITNLFKYTNINIAFGKSNTIYEV